MIWLILASIGAVALLVTIGYVIGSGMQHAAARYFCQQRDEARAQRDRLNTRCADLTQCLTEADAQLQLSVQEIHGLREANKSLQLQLQEAQRPRKRRAGQPVVVEDK